MGHKSFHWSYAACGVGLLVGASFFAASPAAASAPNCRVKNINTHHEFASTDGRALTSALHDAAARGKRTTLQITGVCVGNYKIVDQRIILVGRATRDLPTPTLRGVTAVGGSVLHITGASSDVVI